MTFQKLFGRTLETQYLDFLGDHPNYSYTTKELDKCYSSVFMKNALDNLIESNLIIRKRGKYQINVNNLIIQAVLKYDFERGIK